MTSSIGLLCLRDLRQGDLLMNPYLLPTQLKRIRVKGEVSYDFGDPSQDIDRKAERIYWDFKSDLLTKPSELIKNSKSWKMNISDNFNRGDLNLKNTLNPHEATEEFLVLLCEKVISRLQGILGEDTHIKMYFSAPSYEKTESGTYRENFRKILGRIINKRMKGASISFPQMDNPKSEPFLYEQYGVYHYFTRCERKVNLVDSNKTYLFIDIGGSTTDIAIVQLTQKGDISLWNVIPIRESFQYGGRDFNLAILKFLMNDIDQLDANDLPYALERIEEKKILIFSGRSKEEKIDIDNTSYLL